MIITEIEAERINRSLQPWRIAGNAIVNAGEYYGLP